MTRDHLWRETELANMVSRPVTTFLTGHPDLPLADSWAEFRDEFAYLASPADRDSMTRAAERELNARITVEAMTNVLTRWQVPDLAAEFEQLHAAHHHSWSRRNVDLDYPAPAGR